MSELWTAQEVFDKIEWEGGINDAIEWGLFSEQIEDPKLRELWAVAEQLYEDFREARQNIYDYFDELKLGVSE